MVKYKKDLRAIQLSKKKKKLQVNVKYRNIYKKTPLAHTHMYIHPSNCNTGYMGQGDEDGIEKGGVCIIFLFILGMLHGL